MDKESESFESLWAYYTAADLAVPSPQRWNELYERLKSTQRRKDGGWVPSMPLILGAWHIANPLQKVTRFREHIEWACDANQLDEIGLLIRNWSEPD